MADRLLGSTPRDWKIYKQLPGFVLGFHGCDKSVAEDVLHGRKRHLKLSQNEHDWLGDGIYFWESDPWRALNWARDCALNPRKTAGTIKTPWVIGAVVHLGECCNLTDFDTLRELKRAYQFASRVHKVAGVEMPKNIGGPDKAMRFLDRLVVEQMHSLRDDNNLPRYDTVRAAFVEGAHLYDDAGFREKNHIQLAVRNRKCIKGYFRLPGY